MTCQRVNCFTQHLLWEMKSNRDPLTFIQPHSIKTGGLLIEGKTTYAKLYDITFESLKAAVPTKHYYNRTLWDPMKQILATVHLLCE